MAPGAGNEFIGQQQNTQGVAVGPALGGSLFVPNGMGLCFVDSAGAFWKLRLATDANGNTVYDGGGSPTIELVQVTI